MGKIEDKVGIEWIPLGRNNGKNCQCWEEARWGDLTFSLFPTPLISPCTHTHTHLFPYLVIHWECVWGNLAFLSHMYHQVDLTILISPSSQWAMRFWAHKLSDPNSTILLLSFPRFQSPLQRRWENVFLRFEEGVLLLCSTFPEQHCVFPGENGGCHFEIIQKFPPFCPIFWPKKEPWIPFKKKSTVFLCQLLSVPICENDLILNHHPSSFLQ